jgi:hypothetical protein
MPVLTPVVAVRVSPHPTALARLRAKQRVVAQVIAGTLSLLEAAALFGTCGHDAAARDGESLCRAVIGWVHLALSDRPEQAEAVSQQLEEELQAVLARRGCVQLPLAG